MSTPPDLSTYKEGYQRLALAQTPLKVAYTDKPQLIAAGKITATRPTPTTRVVQSTMALKPPGGQEFVQTLKPAAGPEAAQFAAGRGISPRITAGLETTKLGISQANFGKYTKEYTSFINNAEKSINEYNLINAKNGWINYDWSKYKSDKYGVGLQAYRKDIADLQILADKTTSEYATNKKAFDRYISEAKGDISKLKDIGAVQEGFTQAPEYVRHPSEQWTVTYGDGKTKTFSSQYDADKFADSLDPLGRAKQQALNQMVDSGLARISRPMVKRGETTSAPTTARYVLTKPQSALTNEELTLTRKAGFNIPELTDMPSWNLFKWSQTLPKDSFGQKEAEYYSAVLGAGESALVGTYQALGSIVGGVIHPGKPSRGDEPVAWRQVTPSTVQYLKDLSPQQQAYLNVGGFGGAFLGSYVAMLPIGVVTSGLFQAATNIAKVSGIKLPRLVGAGTTPVPLMSVPARIASEIAAHPKLLQAVLFAPQVGMDAVTVYTQYKGGKPIQDILGEEAVRAGAVIGGYVGLSAGMKLPSKVQAFIETLGKQKIPIEAITNPRDFGQKIGLYKSKTYYGRINEFNKNLTYYTAEDYLGDVPYDLKRLWHGTAKDWEPIAKARAAGMNINEYVTLQEMDIKPTKLGGLYLADSLSPLRVVPGAAEDIPARLGLPGIKGAPIAISVDAYLGTIPDDIAKLSRAEIRKWFEAQAGKGVAYLPPESMMTGEREANLPAGTRLLEVGDRRWYTNWSGNRILVSNYMVIPEEATQEKLIQAGLGNKIVSPDEIQWVDPSTSYGKTVYLSYGISPASIGVSGLTELTSDQVSYLADEYGLSESEVAAISSSVSSSLLNISAPYSYTSTSSSTVPTAKSITAPEASSTVGPTPSETYIIKEVTITSPPSVPYEPEEPPPSTPPPTTPPPTVTPPPSKRSLPMVKLSSPLAEIKRTKYHVVLDYHHGRDDIWSGIANNYHDAMNKALTARTRRDVLPVGAELRRIE